MYTLLHAMCSGMFPAALQYDYSPAGGVDMHTSCTLETPRWMPGEALDLKKMKPLGGF